MIRRHRRRGRLAEDAGVTPTARNILEWLGPYMEHEGLDAPRESARLARLIRTQDDPDKVLEEANRLIDGHGIEGIRIEGAYIDHYYFDIVATYVNTGDTYSATLLHESETGRFLLTTWGDWFEANERKYLPEEEEEEEDPDWDADLDEARRRGRRARDKAYFSPASGEEDGYGYAVKIDGIENDFPRLPFGRQLDAHQAVSRFKATARSEWISTKRRKGQRPLTEIKRWVKAVNPSQFYARWPTRVDDDSLEIWYTI